MELGHRLGWASLTLTAALAGCPSDPVGTDAGRLPDSPTPPTEDTGTASDSPTPAGNTIADLVAGNPDFSILLAAASRAGIATVLDSPGTYTVFAPSDDAFAASGITLAAIEAMEVETLTGILTYHALAAEVPSSAVTAGPATSIAGFSLIIGTTGGVTLNGGNAITGGANVVTPDVEADNGVIHIIDRVLLPPDVPALARYAGLTSLLGAVGDAGLADDLAGEGPFTVFAPTNEAFAALPAVPTGDALAQVLLYHVVAAEVESTGVPARASSLATNAYGDPLTLLFNTTGGVTINGGPTVVIADVRATNGIVHVIDEVILPMNVVGAATAAGLTGLLGAVGAAADIPGSPATPVAAALSAQAPYTVFAPTNAAFEAASGVTATLSPAQLRDVLLFHVLDTTAFAAPVLSGDLPMMSGDLRTLNGASIAYNSTGPTFDGAGLAPGLTDIVVTNGVIHVIDAVMVP